jgi:hypothetical protein
MVYVVSNSKAPRVKMRGSLDFLKSQHDSQFGFVDSSSYPTRLHLKMKLLQDLLPQFVQQSGSWGTPTVMCWRQRRRFHVWEWLLMKRPEYEGLGYRVGTLFLAVSSRHGHARVINKHLYSDMSKYWWWNAGERTKQGFIVLLTTSRSCALKGWELGVWATRTPLS